MDGKQKTTPAQYAAQHERARSQFGAVAAQYAVSHTHAYGESLGRLVEMAQPGPEDRVLDVGTGAGHAAFAFAPYVAEVVASDITEEMLAQVRRGAQQRELANIVTTIAAAEALQFPPGSFQIVLSRVAAHHFADPQAFMRSAFRVTAPGGILAFSDTISPDDDAAVDAWLTEIEHLRDPSHVRDWSAREWQQMAEAAGYSPEAQDTTGTRAWQTFEEWTQRMNVPPDRYARLVALFSAAPPAAREWAHLEPAPEPQRFAWGFPQIVAIYRKEQLSIGDVRR